MRGAVLFFSFALTAFMPLSVLNAQNKDSEPISVASADYPMDRPGIFVRDLKWVEIPNQSPAKTKVGRGFAASLSYGAIPAKLIAEYAGDHARTHVSSAQPVLCICHLIGLPGDPVLVRLHPKKDSRELDGGSMVVYPVVGNSKQIDAKKSDLIPVGVLQPEAHVWLIHPESPLDPGEYALMLGTENLNIYPFRVVLQQAAPSGSN